MDREFNQELSAISNEIVQKYDVFQNEALNKLAGIEKKCIESSSNAENFANCIMKSSKKLQKAQKRLEFSVLFLKHRNFKCFEQESAENKNYDKCKNQATKDLDGFFKNFLDSL